MSRSRDYVLGMPCEIAERIFRAKEARKEIPKFKLIDHGESRLTLKRVYNAKPYPACDLCERRETCKHAEIAEVLGYYIVECELKQK